MGRVLKWLGIVVGAIIGLIIVAVIGLYAVGSSRVSKTYSVQPVTISIPTDAAAIERGRHLVESFVGCGVTAQASTLAAPSPARGMSRRGRRPEQSRCGDCHGENLGGAEFFNDPAVAVAYAPNLTAGQGGAGAEFSDADWVRALRHGVDPEGRALFVMPASVFQQLSAREREVLELLAQGYKNAEIAERLVLSPKTVRNHISNIFSKLQVADRAEAILRAREAGLGSGL